MTEIFFNALCRLAAITNEAPLHDH
ncbi:MULTISPECIES: protein YrbN [unclassified Photorhabdus]|nr:protein YrbN [Photorhabdus temperata]